MKKQERRQFTPEQKPKILREHHLDKVPVSDLCEKYKLRPSVFYDRQRALFERASPVRPTCESHQATLNPTASSSAA
ncbi:hypothetical protein [Nannocystis punicea]|uniref:Transposase n=1 Tax=Nannocystis punicea TaxID=2995304 RepID=A0ABY7GX06_9BACT|nr:hypothetical protein [Nannocystis poenicansa]WAS91473.1 hypothetical protein O0S08_35265 [Nannocystis poenicansa]